MTCSYADFGDDIVLFGGVSLSFGIVSAFLKCGGMDEVLSKWTACEKAAIRSPSFDFWKRTETAHLLLYW